MKRMSLVSRAGALLCAGLVTTTMAHAQAVRTWVSGVGDDINPCSRTAPCKTFPGAISKTAAGGEISVLDPGSYGAVTITKSITIDGAGQLAGITSSLVNAIIINAAATDRVVIRNITINGTGNGLNGIRYLAGGQVLIENVAINGVTGRGIDVQVPAGGGTLTARNVTISRAATGLFMSSVSGSVVATLENVSMNGLTTGIELSTNGFAIVRNSTINRNTTGVLVNSASANAFVENSTISFNTTAVNAVSGGARVVNSAFYFNTTNFAGAAGAIHSTGDNRVDGSGGAPPSGTAIVEQ